MARPIKNGLDYFPFDVDFFTDEKIKLIGASHGSTGLCVIVKILCRIYRNGYFTKWNPDEIANFAKYDALIPVKKLTEIIEEALKREFFNEGLYKKYSILTSRGIQKRYFTACKSRKSLQVNICYLLVNLNDYVSSDKVNSNLIEDNSEFITQSREKEKEIKTNEIESKMSSLIDFYESELAVVENNQNLVSPIYSDLVSYILGKNELHNKLIGLITFEKQLSFAHFNELWNNKCGVISEYKKALLKISENHQYQKGDSLYARLISWFDNEKNPETLHPVIKPKKILNTNN